MISAGMFQRMPGPGGGGGVSQQREAAFDRGRRTGAAAVLSSPPLAPPKLFLAAGSGVSGEEASSPTELGGAVLIVSPTSTLQAPVGSPTAPATTAVPFSRRGTSSPCGDFWRKSRSRSHHPWEVRPVGLGIAGSLDGYAAPPASTVLTGHRIRPPPVQATNAESCPHRRRRCLLSAREMEASEDYTRVIARGPNPRTTHIFDGRVVEGSSFSFSAGCGDGEAEEFLRWCHGCSKHLGEGEDIFMYRGEMAFCSHECRYREMLLVDEEF